MSIRYKRGRSRERLPLRPGQGPTSYGGVGPIPGSSRRQSPPPYSAAPGLPGGGYQETHASQCQRDPSPPRPAVITKGRIAVTAVFLVLVAQLVAFVFFYDLPTKFSRYAEFMVRMRMREDAMREEAKHLENERTALREEREKWEKAREDRIPPGAFWEIVQPSPDCISYGKREYRGVLRNIPKNWTDLDACMNMPVEIKGIAVRRPNRRLYVEQSPHIHGFWMVDWNQLDCQPWHRDFDDRGCTNAGSGIRRIEAWVVGINERGNQDWRLLCESTPMTWNHITYNAPTHCDAHWTGRKVAMWDIPDKRC